jgi:hypothetical protein
MKTDNGYDIIVYANRGRVWDAINMVFLDNDENSKEY